MSAQGVGHTHHAGGGQRVRLLSHIAIAGLLVATLGVGGCVRDKAAPGPSAKALAYAESLSGVSQTGKTLYFVIGASVGSELEAQKKLDAAIPRFGDMQSYFVIQRSDNFDGMTPGYWVLVEAYEKEPSAENLQFARRAFPDAYVKRAKVLTTDPIPVYEQVLDQ